MTTDTDMHRKRARDAINAARRGHLPKPRYDSISTPTRTVSMASDRNIFETAQENSIEVYDDKFGRNTILTRSARMRKFRFYQYKPVLDSLCTPKLPPNGSSTNSWNHNNYSVSSDINNSLSSHERRDSSLNGTPQGPVLLPRDDVLQGKVALVAEQSKELVELDDEILQLEKKIADLNESGNSRNVDNLDEIFALVNKKNDLLRRQMQLNIIEQEKVLEKANEELTKELRSLMSIDDSRKSKAQLERQRYLYDQSLALVNKRNELVHHMDVQERAIEDDNALKAALKNAISDTATRNKLSRNSQNQSCTIQ